MKNKKDENIKLEDVRRSDCGCKYCWLNEVECKQAEKFIPKWNDIFELPSCEEYVFGVERKLK